MPKQRETCTECSLRRQKCDKGFPCGRCVKRGVQSRCTRVWSQTHRPHGRSLSSNRTFATRDRRTPASNARASDAYLPGPLVDHGLAPSEYLAQGGSADANSLDDAILLPAADYPQLSSRPGVSRITQIDLLQLEMPSMEMIEQLVRFHERSLLWYHGCYHGPTFRAELQAKTRLNNDTIPVDADLQWSALLFAILAGSLICANDRTLTSWRFKKADIAKQASSWYRAAVWCLSISNYIAHHSLHAVQAITTLTVSAHTLGLSNEQSVLLGAALKIAQSLGIHRLEFLPSMDVISAGSTAEQRQQVLTRETCRRLWSQLCAQDWFSVPATEAFNINPLFSTGTQPGNRDFLTMEAIPESIPTYVSYGNYLNDIARLIAGLQEALASSHTARTQYDHVLEYDAKMRSLATKDRPVYFNVTEQVDPTWQDFVPWARRSLTICFSHKIIMIHRTFLCRSFTNAAFSFTRLTCIAAAKTIINEAKQDNSDDGPIIWIDQAFCVAAGITLVLDAKHRKPEEPELAAHLSLVQDCVTYLKRFEYSSIATKGVRLLRLLLAKVGRVQYQESPCSTSRRQSSSAGRHDNPDMDLQHLLSGDPGRGLPFTAFEELFPPQTGFTNALILEEVIGRSGVT